LFRMMVGQEKASISATSTRAATISRPTRPCGRRSQTARTSSSWENAR
jgi:hypothetical protein